VATGGTKWSKVVRYRRYSVVLSGWAVLPLHGDPARRWGGVAGVVGGGTGGYGMLGGCSGE
jgi:hypothetical protein